jgi:hypothetical protein
MTYLGTPWIDFRVPYASARKILAICRPQDSISRFPRLPGASDSLPTPKRTSGDF